MSEANKALAEELRATIEQATDALLRISAAQATVRPAPGKWSPIEVIGHLVDSASNNHQRFVRAQFSDELVFPGYAQDEWVHIQRYQAANWPNLVALWRTFNLHLAWVIASTPDDVAQCPRTRHNLHQIGWQTVPEDQPTTLAYFMRDYVDHLKHHLRQLGIDA